MTTVEKMVAVFRRQYKIPDDKQITIMFDGEALGVELLVQDTEIIECGDGAVVLDVHVR
jgi:hypothetical protein